MKNIAALIEAAAHLHPAGAPDPELIGALAGMLGLVPSAANTGRPGGTGNSGIRLAPSPLDPAEFGVPRPQSRNPYGLARGLSGRPAGPRTEPPSPAGDASLQARPTTLRKVAQRADLAPGDGALHPAARERESGAGDTDASSAPVESLFAPNRVRAILRGLATVPVPSGEPDMTNIIDMIARAVPVARLPERSVHALGHSVQLLFDAGPTMLPFTQDKQQLALAAVRLIGRDRVRVADFLGAPPDGIRAQRSVRWQPFDWPDRRSTVVVVSDLGSGDGRQGIDLAWRDFLDQAARRQVCTVALIPYPASRWPDGVEEFDAALTWDLATGVRSLRRALRLRRRAT